MAKKPKEPKDKKEKKEAKPRRPKFNIEGLQSIDQLNRDMALASITMSEQEVRFLVDAYYQMQDNRIRSDGQIRSMEKVDETGKPGEPHAVLQWLSNQNSTLEKQIKNALDTYSRHHRDGQWLRSVHGIGPVISAGLLAHIDIDKAPTAGHIWRYAGLDPTIEWKSAEYMRGFVKGSRETQGSNWAAFVHLCFEMKRRPLSLLHQAGLIEYVPDPDAIRDFLRRRDSEVVLKAEFHADNMLHEALSDEGLPDAYDSLADDLFPELKFDWKKITSTLAKRPWNSSLKVICWKAGESFVKFSNNDDCFYGKIYAERKYQEILKNERGDFAEQAQEQITKKRYGHETAAYQNYVIGKLPPAHIHARARRYAVKLFLAHFHDELYWNHFNVAPPLPYPIAHQGHTHYIQKPVRAARG